MRERELLELAARAADDGIVFYGECWRAQSGREWNPLLDDGDALRLAVKLGVNIESYSDTVSADGIHEDRGFDDCAATRRAIVRAAAAIGKEM